ncbi:MAG: LLM class flavin-dependent oxidoreductase, partial [Candidatus Acidiferrales bacterium]
MHKNLKFLVIGGNQYREWKSIMGAVTVADQLGYWGFVMPDHYMLAPEWGGNSTLDTWIALTYLASKTEKIRLGTLVTPIPLRPPAILAKMIATLDIISNGRVVVGIGAGWSQTEFEGYSEWNDPRVRVNKTKEGLELMIKLWLDYDSKSKTDANPISFQGKYYHSKNAVLAPKPVQKPYPKLLFGGTGLRMLKLAGIYSDICCIPNWINSGNDSYENAKEIVLDTARKYNREDKISFATILSLSRTQQSRFAPK